MSCLLLLLGLVCLAGGRKRATDVRFSLDFCLIAVHAVGKKSWRMLLAGDCLGSIVVLFVFPSPSGQPLGKAGWVVTAILWKFKTFGKSLSP